MKEGALLERWMELGGMRQMSGREGTGRAHTVEAEAQGWEHSATGPARPAEVGVT